MPRSRNTHTTKIQLVLLGAFLLALGGVLYQALSQGPQLGSGSPLENAQGRIHAPDFGIPILLEPKRWAHPLSSPINTLSLQDIVGKPTIINFWASWCTTCAEEAPLIEKVWNIYATSPLQIIGVVLHDDADKAQEYAQITGKTYLIAHDKEGRMAIDYGVSAVPESVFIYASGKVHDKVVGALDAEVLLKHTTSILAHSTHPVP